MNIQEENSARYFRVQSEREQTLAMSKKPFALFLKYPPRLKKNFLEDSLLSTIESLRVVVTLA